MVGMEIRFALVELVVADMAASLAFYRALGLEVPDGAEGEPHVDFDLGGGSRLALDTIDTIRSMDPAWQPAEGGHKVALAFDCGTPEGVDSAYARMVGEGHEGHLEPWDAFWGHRYAVLHDPDGNPVDLFAPLATS